MVMNNGFVVIGGYVNIIAGVALVIYWYSFAVLLPYRDLSTTLSILVKNRNWTWINSLGVLGALCGLLGQASIYVYQLENSNIYATSGYYVAVTGTVLLIGTMLWETILWPILVEHESALLDFQGPIYTSKTFLPFFVISGLIYSVGYILVGIGILQAGVLPFTAGLLIAIGAPTFGLGSLFGKLQIYPRSIGVTLISVGLIWVGYSILA
jgi:hypothetical protein